MGVSGNLKTMLPGDLLQWLGLGQKTGTLVVTTPGIEKKIYFKNGRVISSASNDPREYLGQFLMSHGFLNEGELKKAMEVQQQSGILLGKILTMIEVINEADLTRLMRLKVEETVYDMFLWRDGEFNFIDGELPNMEMVPLQVDVTGIIMEGTRRVDEWLRIRELIPNDVLVPVLQKAINEEELAGAQRTIAHTIDGKRTIADIVLESRSSAFLVSSTLYNLVRDGYVKLVDPEVKAKPLAPEPAEDFNEHDEIATLLNYAQTALRAHDYEKAQRLLKAAQNLDPNHPKVRNAIKGAQSLIVTELRKEGIEDSKIPMVKKSLDEITTMNISPNEGFILSRINGTWDIGSLIKISPIREPDAMLIFYRLWKNGIIELK
jgi:hypothetical protein